MTSVGGPNPVPEPLFNFNGFDEEISGILSENQTNLDEVDNNTKTNNQAYKSEVLNIDITNKEPFKADYLNNRVKKLDSEQHAISSFRGFDEEILDIISKNHAKNDAVDNDTKIISHDYKATFLVLNIDNKKKGPVKTKHLYERAKKLDPKKHAVVVMVTKTNEDPIFIGDDDHKKMIKERGLALPKNDLDKSSETKYIEGRNIVYIGVSSEQYQRIFSAANRMIALAAEEYEKNKKKNEEGGKHSFYNRSGFYEKLDLNREWKKLISKINDSEFAKKIKNIKKQTISADALEKTLKKNEKTREKNKEKRMEFYEEQDKKRGIVKEYNNKEDIKESNDKQEGIEDEHLG